MARNRTYRAQSVEDVRLDVVLPLLAAGCIVALDVAKEKFVAALATLAGEVVQLFRFQHPTQTPRFLEIIRELRIGVAAGQVRVAMEPTGTYGDVIRHQLVEAQVPVCMVSPKRTHDSQALFDNVSSLHDPKSAVLIAKLCAMGLATDWKEAPTLRTRMRALVDLRHHEEQHREVCFGRLEALLSRHWPEFYQSLDIREQKTALRVLATYASPARVEAAGAEATALMRNASRGMLAPEKIGALVASAATTLGVPANAEEVRLISTLATYALDAWVRIEKLEKDMANLAANDAVFTRLRAWMGIYTAASILTRCDPMQYANARQLEKACGLNLREKSSGKHVGRLMITKRGPAQVRQVLFLFALRMIQQSSVVRAWYVRRRGYTEESKVRAVVAVMRKLVRALFHVARGADFDPEKLFDTRRLRLQQVEGGSLKKKRTPPSTSAGAHGDASALM